MSCKTISRQNSAGDCNADTRRNAGQFMQHLAGPLLSSTAEYTTFYMILHDFTALLTSLQVGFAAFEALKKEGVQVHRRPVSWRLRQHLAKSWCIVVSRVVELG
jgi:hypothetical protein